MSWSLVAHQGASGTIAPTTAGVDTTGANLLIAVVSQYNAVSIGSVSDNKGNTWSPLTAQTGGSETYARIWYCEAPNVGSGHTVTFSFGVGIIYGAVVFQAWGGAAASSAFDQENGATSASAASLATGSITPSEDGELVIAGFACGTGSSGNSTINGGFTVNAEQFPNDPGVALGCALAHLIQTTATAANPTWSTGSGTSTGGLSAVIASFKGTGGAASTFIPQMRTQQIGFTPGRN